MPPKVVIVDSQPGKHARALSTTRQVARSARRDLQGPAAVREALFNFVAPISAGQFRWPFSNAAITQASKTGVASVPSIYNYTQSNTFAGTYTNDPNLILFYQFRSVLRSLVKLVRIADDQVYNVYSYNPATGACVTNPTIYGGTDAVPIPVTYLAASGTANVHGPYRDWETDRKSTRLNSSHRL